MRAESDRRIKLIVDIKPEFNTIIDADYSSLDEKIAKAEFLVSLHEQERLYGSMEDVYRIAALSYSKAGRMWEALKWTMKATDAYLFTEAGREPIVREIVDLNQRNLELETMEGELWDGVPEEAWPEEVS